MTFETSSSVFVRTVPFAQLLNIGKKFGSFCVFVLTNCTPRAQKVPVMKCIYCTEKKNNLQNISSANNTPRDLVIFPDCANIAPRGNR